LLFNELSFSNLLYQSIPYIEFITNMGYKYILV